MKIFSSLILLSLFLVEATPSLLSIANSVFEWTTDLGPQVPGITPLFVKLSDGVALASLVQDNEKQFHLNVTTFDVTGNRRAKCDVPLLALPARLWNTRLTYLGGSAVGFTCLFNDRDKLESGLRLAVIYLDNCAFNTVTVNVDKNVDYVYHIPYAVVPYEGGEFDVFVKSSTVCGHGICRIGFKTDGQQIVKNGEPVLFMDDKDDFLGWIVAPVDPYKSSKGFYFIGIYKDEQASSVIIKIDTETKELISRRGEPTRDRVVGYSNAHGNFGICISTPASSTVDCELLGQKDFSDKIKVSVPVEGSVRKIGMANDRHEGFLLLLNSCLDEHCFEHVTVARKIGVDGKIGEAVEFARSRAGCHPRSNYDLFVDEKDDVYCTGAPCLRKLANSSAYKVSAHIKCLKNV